MQPIKKGGCLPIATGANGRFNSTTGAYKPNPDPATGQDDYWRGWDQILADTVMHDSDANRNNAVLHGTNEGWWKVFECPSDYNPRIGTTGALPPDANITPRSYAVKINPSGLGACRIPPRVPQEPPITCHGRRDATQPSRVGAMPSQKFTARVVQKRLDQGPAMDLDSGVRTGVPAVVYGYYGNNPGVGSFFANTATVDAVFGEFAQGMPGWLARTFPWLTR